MWKLDGTAPEAIEARVLTTMPGAFAKPVRSEWADANKAGEAIPSFLEGPAFDRAGNLWVVDIPHGRLFRISPTLEWTLAATTGGWPNGLAIHRDGTVWIADYRRGILRLDPVAGEITTVLGHRNSESLKGVNDIAFDAAGNCYFTDQGQTGLHDPTGRVHRLCIDGRLDTLLANVPSPNGIALDAHGKVLFVAATRANAVWRGPLLADGSVSKVGAFRTFFGASGPDGLAMDAEGRLVVAHASLGGAFVLNAKGEVTHFVRSPVGTTVTNVAFRPGTSTLVLTESATGTILVADLPAPGLALFSHA
jgi:gluconolactonase